MNFPNCGKSFSDLDSAICYINRKNNKLPLSFISQRECLHSVRETWQILNISIIHIHMCFGRSVLRRLISKVILFRSLINYRYYFANTCIFYEHTHNSNWDIGENYVITTPPSLIARHLIVQLNVTSR